jgi:hypothetical protein
LPELAVVLPLIDDRGYGQRALASWIGQTLAAERFEIVAVADDAGSRLARRARWLLRPHDRLVVAPGATEMELYTAGAEAARAELLLFTEAHCLAQPDAAAALLRHFSGSPAAAAQLAGEPLAPNAIARFETRLLEDGLRSFPADAWRRVSLRGFGVRRAAWVAAGSFAVGCGRLAEAILGVRLQRLGLRIDACPEARVRHGNCNRLRDLAAALRPHGRGQGAWRERCEAGLETDFLPPLSDWSERARWTPHLARHSVGVLVGILGRAAVRREWRGNAASAARALPACVAAALLGPRLPRALAAARARLLLAVCRFGGGEERRYRAYGRACSELLRCGVLDHAAASALPAAPAGELLRPAGLQDGALVGFHAAERWSADEAQPTCRWTRPFALLRLGLTPADYRLRLELRSPVPPQDRALRIFFNGRPVSAAPDGGFALWRRWFRRGEQLLAIACAPFHPARAGLDDPRELGVALFALRFERLSDGVDEREPSRRQGSTPEVPAPPVLGPTASAELERASTALRQDAKCTVVHKVVSLATPC